MISKILSWCWKKKWFVLPALVAIPLLLAKLFGGGLWWLVHPPASCPPSPISPEQADAQRERIHAHGEAARDEVSRRADEFQERLARIKRGDN